VTAQAKTAERYHSTRQTIALALVIVAGLTAALLLTRRMDARHQDLSARAAEEQLYLKGSTARRLSLAFNGLAADWYWMRSLQYVGRKAVRYRDTHNEPLQLNDLGVLNLQILAPLLRVTTTLDPQFMAPYEYGAMILPTYNEEEAISLLNYGIQQNPNAWRLYQHLGYIYWKRNDYQKASEIYAAGGRLPGAPRWVTEMSARMAAEGGSRQSAREMYQHLYDEAADDHIKDMLAGRLMQVDSFDQRDLIKRVLGEYTKRFEKCPSAWREIAPALRALRFRVDNNGAPLDPSGTAYVLVKNGCDVDVDPQSKVPYR
jgi:tetratricopeptide (TPR) repeat protein